MKVCPHLAKRLQLGIDLKVRPSLAKHLELGAVQKVCQCLAKHLEPGTPNPVGHLELGGEFRHETSD